MFIPKCGHSEAYCTSLAV